ncbi:MAG: hypothetical protein J6W75_08765 [Bacteroidaceae bacterium]|nr:hypothetical protein [Bacteroidaceae bacterium]
MIKITKGKEPAEWTEERNTPGISYETTHKDALRLALLEEQGWLCGYCMRRVSFAAGTQTDTRIEHLKPRTLSLSEGKPEETLAYGNMILCCNGDIDGSRNLHCDASKGEKEIHFTPFEAVAIATISYSSKDGSIKSSNETYDSDLNNVLNLNHPILAANRLAVIKGLVKEMGRKTWKKSDIVHKISYYSGRNAKGQLHEYCGVVIWYLNKKLRQFA